MTKLCDKFDLFHAEADFFDLSEARTDRDTWFEECAEDFFDVYPSEGENQKRVMEALSIQYDDAMDDDKKEDCNAQAPAKEGMGRKRAHTTSEYDVAMCIVRSHDVGLYDGIPYICKDGVHEPITLNLMGKLVAATLQDGQKREISAKAFSAIQLWLEAILANDGRVLKHYPNIILFENGAYDFIEEKFVRIRSDMFLPVKIQCCYDVNQDYEAPVFEEFLRNASGGDSKIRDIMLAALGYMISPAEPDKVLLLAPAAGSGKSVFGNLIRMLLGDKTCAIDLAGFGKPFELAQIYGKSANFCLDISGATLSEAAVSAVKRLSGDDTITINAKYQLPVHYRNYAKLCFACNEGGIRLRSYDSGIDRRLTVVPFLHTVSPREMDKNLPKKLWEERGAIVHLALKALRKLHFANYVFPVCPESIRLKQLYLGTGDLSVAEFIEQHCQLSPDEREWTDRLYTAYCRFCAENGYEHVTKALFSRRIHAVNGVKPGKWQDNGTQLHGYKGISLKQ